MNKRNSALLLLLLLLLLVAGYFFWKANQGPRVSPNEAFAVKDTSSIQKVVITDTKGGRVVLTKNGKSWLVNDKLPAMPVKINFLLSTINDLKVVAPVGTNSAERVSKSIEYKHVRVEIYDDKNGSPKKVYDIGEPLLNDLGNYAYTVLNGVPANPFIIGITNVRGDLQSRFFTDTAAWRDTKVFDAGIDDIKGVTIYYPYHPRSSFKLVVQGKDKVDLTRPEQNDTVPKYDMEVEKELAKKTRTFSISKVNDFLNSFKFINVEAYNNEYYGKDTILDKKPIARVYLNLKSGETDSIYIFFMPVNQRTKMQTDPATGKEMPYDPDRYYALINHNKDFVVIQQYVFGKILRQYDDFFDYK